MLPDAVLRAALALSPAERSVLAEKILESLWDTDRAAVEAALEEELDRRVAKQQARAKKNAEQPGNQP